MQLCLQNKNLNKIAFTGLFQSSVPVISVNTKSCSEEEEISASEEEEIQTESELTSASETTERSCSADTSADEGKELKKSDKQWKQKPTTSNSSTGTKPKKKAQKKSTDKRTEEVFQRKR